MKRFLWLGFVTLLFLICVGCGDTFRPIIIPVPPNFPNPKAAHTVVAITANGADSETGLVNNGAAMVVDVTGDSTVSVKDVDIHPVNSVQLNASQVLVVNQAVTGLTPPPTGCLVNSGNQVFNVCPSITKLQFAGVVINNTNAITLPPSSAANFITGAPLDTTAYVSLPHYIPDVNNPGVVVPSVAVVSVTGNAVTNFISVGNNPVALAVTPDKSKLYVANHDDKTIGGFNTVDRSQRTGSPTATTAAPIWLLPRTDNQRLYILEESGELAQIDTTSTAGPDQLTEFPTIAVPGANRMVYDSNLNRLYIPGGQQVAIVDVSGSSPALMTGAPLAIPTVNPATRMAGDPCQTTATQTLNVVAAAALPDGSRAYVGAYYKDASGNICPQVTVIDVPSNTIKSNVAVPGFPNYDALCASTRFRFTMAAGGDSSRVYLASCDGGNVNIVDTSVDQYILNLPAPTSARKPIQGTQNPPQNPVFLIAGP